ncbi:iron(III) transport system ATP-binding protein [Devosia crocina]|uniref:Iron(III) transport system ATP-binding protein n=1 Tax=Devosia crocina TaxID=429728 RepID=A0A1I7NCD8_9HYPH|nr:ABC transporter ATP-binding protein [Devosia crocina]SFV32338.1 iron(III) transport system ATP-binding protein [Devosia crocina]
MMQPRPIVVLDQLSRKLGGVSALDGFSLSIDEGEIVCLVGHSGCGKSTLLRVIAGIETLDAGAVTLNGQLVSGQSVFVEPEQRKVGFMFQDYALFPHLTARQNIAFGLKRMDRTARDERVSDIIKRLGIDALSAKYPHQLSGGEQQRIALARALAPQPAILLMDEPFSNLDRGLRESVRLETLNLLRALGTTAIIVTHDPEEALSTGDTVALMHKGRLVEAGTGEAVYAKPQTAYAASFFSQLNRVPACRDGAAASSPLGRFPLAPDHPEPIELLIRPHSLFLTQDGTAARVVDRAFRGEIEQLVLAVDGLAEPLIMRSSRNSGAEIGQIVRVSVRPEEAMIFDSSHRESST